MHTERNPIEEGVNVVGRAWVASIVSQANIQPVANLGEGLGYACPDYVQSRS